MQHPFLTEPTKIAELNNWIDEYQNAEQRFTFTEAEVLQSLWEQGEDILLREDKRFQEATLPGLFFSGQWQLTTHTLANQLIYDSLLNNVWDGEDLAHYLQVLDCQIAKSTFHVFCTLDKRFSLSKNEDGCYHIALNERSTIITLNAEQKERLDSLASQLLAAFPANGRAPWATSELLERIRNASPHSSILKNLEPAMLAQWLRQRDEWMKVGSDLWFPRQYLPSPAKKRRYAVFSVDTEKGEYQVPVLETVEANEHEASEAEDQGPVQGIDTQNIQQLASLAKWKVTLLTLHLNEGYIPIPPQARASYPPEQKQNEPSVLSGIWFDDNSEMTVWLDTTNHRLYGPDITDQLAFLDAGTILEIYWRSTGLLFNLAGYDPEIGAEEARLMDLTELAQLRSTVSESYRASLRAILTARGKSFSELYNELCQRQKHTPNTSTIRAILSSSSEFLFEKSEGKWKLHLDISGERGASSLRKVLVAAQQVVDKNEDQSPDLPSLTAMIAKNRQQLANLRQIYRARET